MRRGRAFALSLAAGAVAGALLAVMNIFVAGAYTEQLADAYVDLKLEEGEFFEEEFDAALASLYLWQAAFPIAMGLAAGAAVAFFYSRTGTRPFTVALAVAGAAWLSLYVIPALKYPPSPEAMFDAEAGSSYTTLFAGYSAASGLAALGSAAGFARTKKKNWYFGAAGAYLAIIAGLFFVFPDYAESELGKDLLAAWRSAVAAGMTAFWFTLGILAGSLLERQEKRAARRGL
jgi:hypothetical protein